MQNHIYDLCKQHMNQHVLLQTKSGEQIEGIITNLDDENVYVTIPTRSDNFHEESRQYNPYGGGSHYPPRPRPRPPYGGYPPYNPGYPPYYGPGYGQQPGSGAGANRLIIPLAALAAIRLIIPLAALAAISVLPFI